MADDLPIADEPRRLANPEMFKELIQEPIAKLTKKLEDPNDGLYTAQGKSTTEIIDTRGRFYNQKHEQFKLVDDALKKAESKRIEGLGLQGDYVASVGAIEQPFPFPQWGSPASIAATALVALSIAGPVFAKQGSAAAMNSLSAALMGFKEGNETRFKHEMQQYHNTVDKVKTQYTVMIDKIKAEREKYIGDAEMLQLAIKNIAAEEGFQLEKLHLTRADLDKEITRFEHQLGALNSREFSVSTRVPAPPRRAEKKALFKKEPEPEPTGWLDLIKSKIGLGKKKEDGNLPVDEDGAAIF